MPLAPGPPAPLLAAPISVAVPVAVAVVVDVVVLWSLFSSSCGGKSHHGAKVDRISADRPKTVRATFPKIENLEKIVNDTHHKVAHQGDPFRC